MAFIPKKIEKKTTQEKRFSSEIQMNFYLANSKADNNTENALMYARWSWVTLILFVTDSFERLF